MSVHVRPSPRAVQLHDSTPVAGFRVWSAVGRALLGTAVLASCFGQSCSPAPVLSPLGTGEQVLNYPSDLPPDEPANQPSNPTSSGTTDNAPEPQQSEVDTSNANPIGELTITASPLEGPAPLTVHFSATGPDGAALAAEPDWNFGDGITGKGLSVEHTFVQAGSYTVKACPGGDAGAGVTCGEIVIAAQESTAGGTTAGGGTAGGGSGGGGGGGTPGVNHAPVGIERGLVIPVNPASTFALGATDADGDTLSFIIVVLPTHATISDAGRVITAADLPYTLAHHSNQLTYQVDAGYNGQDFFYFVANDGKVNSANAGYWIESGTWFNEIPAITSDRWLNPPSLPPPRAITRADYYDFIRHFYLVRGSWGRDHAGEDVPFQQEYAMYEAFFYHVLGEEDYATTAMLLLRGSNAYFTTGSGKTAEVRFDAALPAAQAYLWIKDCPALTADDHAFVKQYLFMLESRLELEKGAFSRAMATGTTRRMLSLLYPNDPAEPTRSAYWQTIWNDWFATRDTFENSINYTGWWWTFLDAWITATGEDAVYLDAQVRALVERYYQQATPIGIMPEYGETSGANTGPGKWIALMEKWATVYRDGRFKWTAHRLFEWTTDRTANMDQWGNIRLTMMTDLMAAYLTADDSVAEVQPTGGSTLSTRHTVRWVNGEEPQQTGYPGVMLTDTMPDKLVLRSGGAVEDMYALVELAPELGHDHIDTAAINCMTASGSLLLSNEPYFAGEHRFHNAFQVRATTGDGRFSSVGRPEMATTVPVMADGQLATYAQVHVDGYMFAPAALDRRVFFVKNSFLWVHDTLTANSSMTAQIGPAWQTVATYGASGDNWLNTCLVTVPVSPVWGEYYLMQRENHPWDLLVLFLPDAQAELQVDDVTWDDTQFRTPQTVLNNMKQRLWYQKSVTLSAGASLHFSSVLAPHAPEPDSSARAASFVTLTDTAAATVVRWDESPGTSWYVGINDGGATQTMGTIATDAKWFLIETVNGVVTQYWLVEATTLTSGGLPIWSSGLRDTVEVTN